MRCNDVNDVGRPLRASQASQHIDCTPVLFASLDAGPEGLFVTIVVSSVLT